MPPPILTLSLIRRQPAVYAIRLQLHSDSPNEPTDMAVDGTVRLEPSKLNACWLNHEEYGKTLWNALFAEKQIQDFWKEARAHHPELRVRLHIEEFALELH